MDRRGSIDLFSNSLTSRFFAITVTDPRFFWLTKLTTMLHNVMGDDFPLADQKTLGGSCKHSSLSHHFHGFRVPHGGMADL